MAGCTCAIGSDRPRDVPLRCAVHGGRVQPRATARAAGVPVVDLTALVGELRTEADRCTHVQEQVMRAAWQQHGALSRQRDLLGKLADVLERGTA